MCTRYLRTIGGIAAAAMLSVAAPAVADDGPITLSMTSNLPANSLISRAMTHWGEELERRTDGQVRIGQATWSGSLLKADSLMPGIGQGIADVGYATPQYNPSQFAMSNAVFPTYFAEGIPWGDLGMQLYHSEPAITEEWTRINLRPVYFVEFPPQLLMTTFKVDGLADLQGKRLRAVGASHQFVRNIGGVPVSVGSAETYTALQRGTVDGVSGNPAYVAKSYNFAEVITQATNTRNGDYSAWVGATINLDTYNELPDSAKEVIAGLEKDMPEYFSQISQVESDAALDLMKEQGVDIVQLSPEAAQEWREAIDPPSIWAEYLQAAEQQGLEPQPILDRLLESARKHIAENPDAKTFVEEWAEKNPDYIRYIE